MGVAVARDFDQAELQFVDRQRGARLLVEMLQRPRGQAGLCRFAADPAMLAAARNRDVERGLNLAQVLVESAAKILQPRVVQRLQG